MMLLWIFPSLWQFCPSGNHAWMWHSCLDYGIGLECQVHQRNQLSWQQETWCYQGFLLASGIPASVRIMLRDGTAIWITGTLVTSSVQGCWQPQAQEKWYCQSPALQVDPLPAELSGKPRVFFQPLATDIERATLTGPSLLLHVAGIQRHLQLGSLLLHASCT